MLCRNCFKMIPDEAKFCPECGAKLGEDGEVLDKKIESPIVDTISYTDAVNRKGPTNGRTMILGIAAAIALVFLNIFLWGVIPQLKDDRIRVSTSSTDLVGKQYSEVVQMLKNDGFEKIETSEDPDLVLGWFNVDGEVERISIEGNSSFSAGDKFEKDVNVVVVYHTFPSSSDTVADSRSLNEDTYAESQSDYNQDDYTSDVQIYDSDTSYDTNEPGQDSTAYVEEEPTEPELSEYEVEDRIRPYIGQPVENVLSTVEELGYTAKYKDTNNGQDFTSLLVYYKPGDENYSADDFFIEGVENVNTDRKSVDILVAMKIIEPQVSEPESQTVERSAVVVQDEPETPVAQTGGGGTVYITNTGEKFHADGCSSLKKGSI